MLTQNKRFVKIYLQNFKKKKQNDNEIKNAKQKNLKFDNLKCQNINSTCSS